MKLKIIECPRDAMQGWHSFIPTQQKIEYINSLLQVGFDTIDFGSFVSPKAIPQMTDTKEVLSGLHLGNTPTKLLAIVANLRGAEEAIQFKEIQYLGFPFSVSPTFQLKNTNSTQEQSLDVVKAIQALCTKHNKELVIYLSMGFGNPYNDPYSENILLEWANKIAALDVKIISLADTVGLATPNQITTALNTLIPAYQNVEFGVHLHSTPQQLHNKLLAALQAGCIRFDGALMGIGGCPMAQDSLVGNIDTLKMINFFEAHDIKLHLHQKQLEESLSLAQRLFV